MDNFYEQFVQTVESKVYKATKIGIVIAVLMALFYLFIMRFIFALFPAILAVLLFILKKRLYIEYEYEFTNGEIDIDRILDKKKRTRAFSFNIRDVQLMGPLDSDEIKNYKEEIVKELDLYPSGTDKKVYTAMLTNGAVKVRVNFVPDEEFVDLCFKRNPRAVKK
ncbi:MAG: DUF6106 family protein [Bacillota bacterium]|nr:DUF6106 family protein [Bacillota bacterium]